MKQYTIGQSLRVSRLAYGCMNLSRLSSDAEREAVVATALDCGINLFDHADIYAAGDCERAFGRLLKQHPDWRERMLLQSKCGIRFPGDPYDDGPPARYDFSETHILRATEGILERLGIEQLDILLLHRPDLLMAPDEVALAFERLQSDGKVAHFGVSNFDAAQIELLQQAVSQPLLVNQVQLSLLHAELIAQGAKINTEQAFAAAAATLDYCRLKGIRLQAWSPVAHGLLFAPPHDAPARVHHTAACVHELAEQKSTNPASIALAWLLRHPAGIQPVVGTTNPERLRQSAEADSVELTREEWYLLLEKAQAAPVP